MFQSGDIDLCGFEIKKTSKKDAINKRRRIIEFLESNGESDIETIAKHIKDFPKGARNMLRFLVQVGLVKKKPKKVKIRAFSGKMCMRNICYFSLIRKPIGDHELRPELYNKEVQNEI